MQEMHVKRTAGGRIRSAKGKLVETMVPDIIQLAWQETGSEERRLSLQDERKYKVLIQPEYIKNLPKEVRRNLEANEGHLLL